MCRRQLVHFVWILFAAGIVWFMYSFSSALVIGIDVTRPIDAPSMTTEVPNYENEATPHAYVLALGDSLAKGTGDSEGQGFAIDVTRGMSANESMDLELINLAIDGQRIGGLASQLDMAITQDAISQAQTLLLSIGGNDLRAISRLSDSDRENAFQALSTQSQAELYTLIGKIKQLNPQAKLIFIGLYPITPDKNDLPYLIQWNSMVHLTLSEFDGTLFVPLHDLFQDNLDRYLSFDGLHPNRMGYQAISNRILDSLYPTLNQ